MKKLAVKITRICRVNVMIHTINEERKIVESRGASSCECHEVAVIRKKISE